MMLLGFITGELTIIVMTFIASIHHILVMQPELFPLSLFSIFPYTVIIWFGPVVTWIIWFVMGFVFGISCDEKRYCCDDGVEW